MADYKPIPRDRENDYRPEQLAARRQFIEEQTGTDLESVSKNVFEPGATRGNIENLVGAAQVPLGVAGPLRIEGEHARGDFYVPLATTEGTLVASYNRGMRAICESGGVRTLVVNDSMQRAPVFFFESAIDAQKFGRWLVESFDRIKAEAETSTRFGKLVDIEQYPAANLMYTRFCYTTGDAAGQNMSGKATRTACEWIKANYPGAPSYVLSGAMDTDKKHSFVNTLRTRGKRVIAEFTLKKDVAERLLSLDTKALYRYRQVSMLGAIQAGSSYTGAHSANGIAALFIATGQDVANVVESHAGYSYGQLLENGDYYWSVTLTSLICATYGGGTGLPTQRECLEMLGCYGEGKAHKFAEIIAAVVLAGDLSLTSAVLADQWVSSHEQMGRNR